jgi:RES domain-containing protein
MPLVWRLTPTAFARKLDGDGNRRHGARWNSPGRGVVYTSVNLSLCVLETLAHLPPDLRSSLPPLAAVILELPERATETISREEMERHRAELPQWCRTKGDLWLSAAQALSLSAPSVIVPQERNVILNPAHPDMALVSILSIEELHFDGRLIRRPV